MPLDVRFLSASLGRGVSQASSAGPENKQPSTQWHVAVTFISCCDVQAGCSVSSAGQLN